MVVEVGAPDWKAFRRHLKELGVETPGELKALDKAAAQKAAAYARQNAVSRSRFAAANAGAIKGYAGAGGAAVGVTTGSARYPAAGAAFWGTLQRTGWFAEGRFRNYGPGYQHPEWVGSDWQVAQHGEGPYAINDALADHLDDIKDVYAAGVIELAHRTAFTDP